MKYSEMELLSWTEPLSKTEEDRDKNAIRMIKRAISDSEKLNGLDIEVFIQGSYANNTNVKSESDVDVCVMTTSVFYGVYAKGKSAEDYGFEDAELSYKAYRDMVKAALEAKFGSSQVKEGKKSLKIDENTYHVKADVVPVFQLRNYYYNNSFDKEQYVEGTWFISKNGEMISNYPKVHLQNGRNKNKATNSDYKKLVRIFKHIKNDMVDDGCVNGEIITSFLVECLVWNVPEEIIMGYSTWTETVGRVLLYLYDKINKGESSSWREVSEMLYLFKGRKWTEKDVLKWIGEAWDYLEY